MHVKLMSTSAEHCPECYPVNTLKKLQDYIFISVHHLLQALGWCM